MKYRFKHFKIALSLLLCATLLAVPFGSLASWLPVPQEDMGYAAVGVVNTSNGTANVLFANGAAYCVPYAGTAPTPGAVYTYTRSGGSYTFASPTLIWGEADQLRSGFSQYDYGRNLGGWGLGLYSWGVFWSENQSVAVNVLSGSPIFIRYSATSWRVCSITDVAVEGNVATTKGYWTTPNYDSTNLIIIGDYQEGQGILPPDTDQFPESFSVGNVDLSGTLPVPSVVPEQEIKANATKSSGNPVLDGWQNVYVSSSDRSAANVKTDMETGDSVGWWAKLPNCVTAYEYHEDGSHPFIYDPAYPGGDDRYAGIWAHDGYAVVTTGDGVDVGLSYTVETTSNYRFEFSASNAAAAVDGVRFMVYKNSFDTALFDGIITSDGYSINEESLSLEAGDKLYFLFNKNESITGDNVTVGNFSLYETGGIFMSKLYNDGMLFQQNKPINLKGFATAEGQVTAKLLKDNDEICTQTVTAGTDGKWNISLPGVNGGYDKYTIKVYLDAVLKKQIQDVVFGELWLASGQSNMEYTLWQTPSAEVLLNSTPDDYLRVFNVTTNWGNAPYLPQSDSVEGAWGTVGSLESLQKVSSVAYYFIAKLRTELDVPVAFLQAAVGATTIDAWLPREAIESDSAVKTQLIDSGRYRQSDSWNQAGYTNFTQMTAQYNQKIAPLEHLNIAGMIWYQGESDSGYSKGAYSDELNLLLHDYSARFGFQDDSIPFIFSHLAPLYYDYDGRSLDKNAEFTEDMSNFWSNHPETTAQIPIYDLPTDFDYTALGSDFGAGGYVHPAHPYTKQPVGERMAKAALAMLYGETGEHTAAVYKETITDDSALLLKFAHVGDGLAVIDSGADGMVSDNNALLKGFTVAGADGVYYTAQAEIVSADTVRVWSDSVPEPVTATYAFTMMNMYSNLCSTQAGQLLYPVVPFKTAAVSGAVYEHPYYWGSCDLPSIWHAGSYNGPAQYNDAWKVAEPNSNETVLSFVSDANSGGSLKVDYSAGTFGIAPNFIDTNTGNPFADTNKDFSRYTQLSFSVKNTTGRELTLNGMRIKGTDGVWYSPRVLGTASASKSLGIGSDWQTVRLDLTMLYQTVSGTQVAGADVLSAVREMEFLFEDAGLSDIETGTVYVDDFTFIIDKTAPTVYGVTNNGIYMNTIISFDEGNATLNGNPFANGTTLDIPGTYTLIVTDLAGNITSIDFSIVHPVYFNNYTVIDSVISGIGKDTSIYTLIESFTIADNTTLLVNDCNGNLKATVVNVNGTDRSIDGGDNKIGTGATITVYNNGQELITYTTVITGDVNGDGKADVLDLIKIRNKIVGRDSLDGVFAEAVDANADNTIDILDLLTWKDMVIKPE